MSRSSFRSAERSFYADGRSVRPQVENTVARGQLHENSYFYTGLINGKEGDGMPFPVTMEVLERGQERYNVYCTPCHSRVGNGVGMIVQRGYMKAGRFQYGAAGDGSAGTFLPCDHERLWRDARLFGADCAGGSLGDCRLYQGAAVEPEGDAGGCSGGSACRAASEHRRARWLARVVCRGVGTASDRGDGHTRQRSSMFFLFRAAAPSATGEAQSRPTQTRPAGTSAGKTSATVHQAVTSEASERRLETNVIWTRT